MISFLKDCCLNKTVKEIIEIMRMNNATFPNSGTTVDPNISILSVPIGGVRCTMTFDSVDSRIS